MFICLKGDIMLETSRTIIDAYTTKSDIAIIDPERKEIIDEYFRDKTGREIAEYLITCTPGETGGLTALSGFYYQFLVTIEYIIEMLEEKWDFVVMEYHDDVVVGKDNKIRFIQVKSSQKIKLEVTASPASGLYTRTKKKINDEYYKQANSWVDKLFSNASLAKKSEGYETEFQLYSSYHFIRTQNYNFDHYTDNKSYNKKLPVNDDLLETLSKQVFDEKAQEYSYFNECGENIEELLERFYLHTGLSLQEIDKFQDHLCMNLNKIIFKGYGENITIGSSDLNYIIGYLFEECTDRSNTERLIITKEKVQNLFDIIRSKAFANASLTINQHDSITVINRVIDELINSVQGFKNSEKISKLIYEYKVYLENWILRENGDLKKLLERLFDGTDKTSIYLKLSITNKENSLLELFTLVVMLIACKNKRMKFEDNKSLIAKKGEDLEMLYAFLRLEVAKKKSEAIEKLKNIIKNTSVEEQLYLMGIELNVVLQNYNDRQFNRIETLEIDVKEQIDIEGLEDFKRLNEVPIVAKVYPGKYLIEDFYSALDEENFEEYLVGILEELKGDIF